MDHSPSGWGNLPRLWGIPQIRLTEIALGCILPSRRTRQGDPEPENRPPNGTGAQAPVAGGGSRPWGSPQGVFGEDRNHAGTERDQRFGHRHKGVEVGRSGVEPSGEAPDRPDETPTGTGPPQVIPTLTGVERAHGETGLGCQVDRAAPPPGGGAGRTTRVPPGTGGRIGSGNGGRRTLRDPDQGDAPRGGAWDAERGSGSEELTGSPGGYLGPFPRFPSFIASRNAMLSSATTASQYQSLSSRHVRPSPGGCRQDEHHRTRGHWDQPSETPIAGQGDDPQYY